LTTFKHKEWHDFSTSEDELFQFGFIYCWNRNQLDQKFWCILSWDDGMEVRCIRVCDAADKEGLNQAFSAHQPDAWSNNVDSEPMGPELDDWLRRNDFVLDLPPLDLTILRTENSMFF